VAVLVDLEGEIEVGCLVEEVVVVGAEEEEVSHNIILLHF